MSVQTAIVLLNWNGWKDTIECLQSLALLAHPSYAVIVVDNASTDGSMAHITKWLADQEIPGTATPLVEGPLITQDQIDGFDGSLAHRTVTLIQANQNGGFAAGNNLGLRLALNAKSDYMWLLNNDTTVDPHALTALEKRMGEDSKIGMVGSVLCYYDQPDIIQAVGGGSFDFLRARGTQIGTGLHVSTCDLVALSNQPITYVAGASMLVSKEFIFDAGLMFEGYFLYFEELDWAFSGSVRWLCATAPESIVLHKEGGSIGTSSRTMRSQLSQYYLHRNLVYFYRRKRKWLTYIALAVCLKEVVKLVLKRHFSMAKITTSALIDGVLKRHHSKQ
ncbi:COG1216 Predicted glycosyltransferases [Comamonadaceae bacterium]